MKDNSSRLVNQITKLFDEFNKRVGRTDLKLGEALADLRQLIYHSIHVFLGEADVARRYGVPVDALSLVSFESHDKLKKPLGWGNVDIRNSWIPIPREGEKIRPAGITNEEYSEYLARLRAEFKSSWEKEQNDRIQRPNVVSNENFQALWYAVECLFRDAFLRPATGVPFRAGTYVRITIGAPGVVKGDVAKQNVPCHVCGENRVIDTCHIIPRNIGGGSTIDNLLFLCPTHHGLLDRGMLSREEWDRIDWSVKSPMSQVYALKVLKPIHEKFWEKLEAGVFVKRHEGAPKGEMRSLYAQCRDEIENGEST